MSGGDSGEAPERPGPRRIDGAARARFVAALRAGTGRDEAAAQAGFSSEAFYYARRRDAVLRLAWVWAVELSALDEREACRASAMAGAAADDAIQPNNRRPMQRRRRGVAFTDARKQLFLDHFAGTADVFASADAAGVHASTVYKHRRTDAVFAAGWDEALAQAYAQLEAEAVRQRLEAQRRAGFEVNPTGEMAKEFDRVMQLLTRLDRQSGRGVREVRPGRQKRLSFEESIELLDRKLRALGARRGAAFPEEREPDG